MIGNPPWDVIEPKSQEFFTEFDPLYRTYDNQAALRKQKVMLDSVLGLVDQWGEYVGRFKAIGNWAKNVFDPFEVALARGKDGDGLAAQWAKHRRKHVSYANSEHPFHLTGSGKQNAYKLFAEVFWVLLRTDGRLGIILPTGIYSDLGTMDLRKEYLQKGRLDLLYSFQNEKRVFTAAHHASKQVVVLATKGGHSTAFRTRFRMGVGNSPQAHEIPDDILRRDSAAMTFTPEDVRSNSPKTLSLVELNNQSDLDVFRKVYSHSFRLGDGIPGWEIIYTQEINMTSDSKHFPPLESWEANGYEADGLGQWIGPEGEVALPLNEGRMIGQFDFSQKGWVSGKGRTAIWRELPFDNKQWRPQFLIAQSTYRSLVKNSDRPKIAFMDVTASTNTRTFVGSAIPRLPTNHKVPTLSLADGSILKTIGLLGVCNSMVFDFMLRTRFASTSLAWFILEEMPIPHQLDEQSGSDVYRMSLDTIRLSFVHRRFAPEWLKCKSLYPELADTEWKYWWAVNEVDRLRLRVEIDAICADLYGLDPDDFDWIVKDAPTDSKGFYRIDRQLPFCERLTGLAAIAFRALKEGKWSAKSAAILSNNEFFDLLGIPEFTNADAAKAKGLPGPLIEKRDGCQAWRPENFPADDPRHGWTWDHCYQDAVALLGSEEAVEEYLTGKSEKNDESANDDEDATFQLKNESPKIKQPRLF